MTKPASSSRNISKRTGIAGCCCSAWATGSRAGTPMRLAGTQTGRREEAARHRTGMGRPAAGRQKNADLWRAGQRRQDPVPPLHPAAAEPGAQVTLAVDERITELLRRALPGVTMVNRISPREEFDFNCALMSLARRVSHPPRQYPRSRALHLADPKRVEKWKARHRAKRIQGRHRLAGKRAGRG